MAGVALLLRHCVGVVAWVVSVPFNLGLLAVALIHIERRRLSLSGELELLPFVGLATTETSSSGAPCSAVFLDALSHFRRPLWLKIGAALDCATVRVVLRHPSPASDVVGGSHRVDRIEGPFVGSSLWTQSTISRPQITLWHEDPALPLEISQGIFPRIF